MKLNQVEIPCMCCGAMMVFTQTGENEGTIAHPRPLCQPFNSVVGDTLLLHAVIHEETTLNNNVH